MLYKNRIVERRSSPFGIITYRLLTCFCLHQSECCMYLQW